MVNYEENSVRTKPIGFAPILNHYFKRTGICDTIDDNVNLDPRRKILSHGEACIAMITAILFQVLQLYRICKFAENTTILEAILRPRVGWKESELQHSRLRTANPRTRVPAKGRSERPG